MKERECLKRRQTHTGELLLISWCAKNTNSNTTTILNVCIEGAYFSSASYYRYDIIDIRELNMILGLI